MKALTLLETLNRLHRKLSDSLTTLDMDKHSSGVTLLEKRERILKEHSLNILQITSLYSLPFNSYMLANPFERWEKLTEEDIKDIINPGQYDLSDVETYEWREAEGNRLFDGWEVNKLDKFNHTYKFGIGFYHIAFWERELHLTVYSKPNKEIEFTVPHPKTLNDFITLCKTADMDLNWNANNESIKNLKQTIS